MHPAATASQTWWGRCHSLCMFITCLCVPVTYNSLTVAWRHATCKHPQIDFLFFLSICSCHYHFWKLPRATLWYAAREAIYFAHIGAEVYWRCLWLWNWPSIMPRPSPPSHEEKQSSEPIEGVQVCHLQCSNRCYAAILMRQNECFWNIYRHVKLPSLTRISIPFLCRYVNCRILVLCLI